MCKVETFYWNKLSCKSLSFELEHFSDLHFVLAVVGGGGGAGLIISRRYHGCVIREKEFSRKVEMSKVEYFYWNRLSSIIFSFELEQLFDLCFVLAVQGVALITSSTYNYCVVRQKEFSRKVEMSKVEYFFWNKLSSKSSSF